MAALASTGSLVFLNKYCSAGKLPLKEVIFYIFGLYKKGVTKISVGEVSSMYFLIYY